MKAKPDESPEAYVLRLRLRIDALEAALRDVCEAALQPCYFEYKRCAACGQNAYLPEHHAPDCPIAVARALLGDA